MAYCSAVSRTATWSVIILKKVQNLSSTGNNEIFTSMSIQMGFYSILPGVISTGRFMEGKTQGNLSSKGMRSQ